MGVFVGVDPGAKGSLCFLDSKTRKMVFLPTPCLELSARSLRIKLMATHNTYGITMMAIEDVHSIHGTSAKSKNGAASPIPIKVNVINISLAPCENANPIAVPKNGAEHGVASNVAKAPLKKCPESE